MKTTLKALTILTAIAAVACNPNDEKVFKGAGNAELKPTATSLDSALSSSENKKATEAANVTYILRVISNSGANLCEGEAQISIMSDFALKIPEAKIQCASLTVDLAGALGAGAGFGEADADADPNISHDGKVLSIKTIANATFDPPRPFILGPIVQDPSKYKNFDRETKHSLTGKDAAGQSYSGSGSFVINVVEEQGSYNNDHLDKPFENVLRWSMTTKGFDDIPASVGLIFEKWEWEWNTRPIMIPAMTLTGRLSDFLKSEDGNEDALLGKVTIKLLVKDYDIK